TINQKTSFTFIIIPITTFSTKFLLVFNERTSLSHTISNVVSAMRIRRSMMAYNTTAPASASISTGVIEAKPARRTRMAFLTTA
ncbi:hypothetical protein BD408DRAFT_195171, partial [Parasitella parasitica]